MIHIQNNIPLAPFTTFKIGGNARYFTSVKNVEDLKEALNYAKQGNLKAFILGGGSNILFPDKGFDGLVVKLENDGIAISEEDVHAGAGAVLMDVVLSVQKESLGGMEYLAGVPGTIGGAVRGNAGAFGVEMKDIVSSVMAFHKDTFEMRTFSNAECEFSYRDSFFKRHAEWMVFDIELHLRKGDSVEIERIIHETVAKREAKHSQSIACAGSFFMNPIVSDKELLEEFKRDTGAPSRDGKLPAGWLIDTAGLRGKKIGGAMVSENHPNYIINTGTATAEDIIMLSSVIKQRVRTQLGVQLREEVQIVH